MRALSDSRSYLLWLAATVLVLSAGLAVLTAVSFRQSDTVEAAARLQADSVNALAFQTEREFLRFRNELRVALDGRGDPDWDSVLVRFDIFASRIGLLRENPTTAKLKGRSEYTTALPKLEALIARIDAVIEAPHNHTTELRAILDTMTDMGPDVQALTFAANSVVTHLMDQQVAVVRQQNRMIGWLVVVQLMVIVSAGAGLYNRHRRLQRERQALEQVNRELEQAKEAAEAADRAKSQFLANMSHELRTPFNGMLGMIDMLQDSELSAAQRDQLHTARGSAQHLLSLLNDILDMSAIDAGRMKIRPVPCDVPQLMAEICRLMEVDAQRKGLTLQLQTGTHPHSWVMADPTRLRQIVLNLVGNAVKFTERGQVQVDVRSEPVDHAVRWTLTVTDTGAGMDATTLRGLFQRFHQADDSATRRHGGTGLGLEISRNLARLMQGDITIESAVGVGTRCTATVLTPVATAPVPAPLSVGAAAAADASPSPQPSTAPATPARRARILVAEDHPVNRKLVGLMLEKMQHEVVFAEDGVAAVAAVDAEAFDLILMDLHMPRMDGLEATQTIRQRTDHKRHIPIVALTADVMDDTRDRAQRVGMTDYLLKPVQKGALHDAIERCLAASSTVTNPG